jgi:hypothetical protein
MDDNSGSKHRGWIASLSDGTTVFQDYAQDNNERGEPSSWQTLLKRLREDTNGLKITQMRLQRGKRTVTSKKNAEGYFHAYEIQKIIGSGRTLHFQGIGHVSGDRVFITWVNEQGDSKQETRSLLSSKIHTTLA